MAMASKSDRPLDVRQVPADTESSNTVLALAGTLRGKDPRQRWQARMALLRIGSPATPQLTELLHGGPEGLRWEAAKVLSDLGDPIAAPALVGALEDRDFGVRWLAAEGLIRLGHQGLIPLFQELVKRPQSTWLREGAHHVLRVLVGHHLDEHIIPVLEALEDVEPALEVPRAAHLALDLLRREPEGGP
jgi:HEAT repeat protein